MGRRHTVRPPESRNVATQSVAKSAPWWTTPATYSKVAVVLFIAGIAVYLSNSRPSTSTSPFNNNRENPLQKSPRAVKDNAGWRLPDAEALKRYHTDKCDIERLSVKELTLDRFEREFRFRKPLIVTFPNGARDWTVPSRWSRRQLRQQYGEWELRSGTSLEIVRSGGNGATMTSFSTFTDRHMREVEELTSEPLYYIFDREFYKDTDLPSTLSLPPYFTPNDSLDDSIFFLGASGTGVVFHKHADTWNGVVFGRKRWFLYPTAHTPPGGVYHGYPIKDWYERVYPNLTDKQRPLECVQHGGEIIYLPEGFYHATLNIGDTVAVSLQKKDATMTTEELAYDVTNLNKELLNPDVNKTAVNTKLLDTLIRLHAMLPENSEVHLKLGEKYTDVGQLDIGLHHIQKAIGLDPYFVLAYTALGKTLAKLKRITEAEAAFVHACQLSPSLWDVYKEYGMFLFMQARYADAIPVFRKGIALNPSMLPFWTFLKAAQERSGDHEGAKVSQQQINQLKAVLSQP